MYLNFIRKIDWFIKFKVTQKLRKTDSLVEGSLFLKQRFSSLSFQV